MSHESITIHLKPILQELESRFFTPVHVVEQFQVREVPYHGWNHVHDAADDWDTVPAGTAFGGREMHVCFKTSFTVPASANGCHLAGRVLTGASDIWNYDNPQFLVYINDRLTCGQDTNHTDFDICSHAVAGTEYTLALYAYFKSSHPDIFPRVEICTRNDDVIALYYDLSVPYELCLNLKEDDPHRAELICALEDALYVLDKRDYSSEAFHASIPGARAILKERIYDRHFDTPVTEYCVGHTHIDVAWEWTLAQTHEKALRSFSSVDHLMERYPEYIFLASTPQLYEFVQKDSPELYKRIQEHVQSGRWEPEGAMWLESDCNLTSGESLVRQFLYGKRFFQQEFGVDSKILWLPDVFGYSAALPQLMKQCGVDYFMTTKIAWNDTNKMPHDAMIWQGLDGTEVLAYFISTTNYDALSEHRNRPFNTTYNGLLNPSQVMGCWQRFQDKGLTRQVLQCYGTGDGGGGVTWQMLEQQRRIAQGLPGCPQTKTAKALDFFHALEQDVKNARRVPKWCGEFYFEFHRGVFTTMADNKKFNRRAEFANAEAELYSLLNWRTGGHYPQQELDENWKLTMLNQFHDILPGSSIREVYEDSHVQYKSLLDSDARLIHTAQTQLTAQVSAQKDGILVYNPTGFTASSRVCVPCDRPCTVFDGQEALPSTWADGVLSFIARDVPAKGWQHFTCEEGHMDQPLFATVSSDLRVIETPYYLVHLNAQGEFARLYDKRNDREILPEGTAGNQFQLFEDLPEEYDAWNLERNALEKVWPVQDLESISLVENSPVRLCLRIRRSFLHSSIQQDIVFYPHTARIDFDTRVHWQETHLMLKVAFPTTVQSNRACYEIQFGNVERDTHTNTSWDEARFEVCGQKWADLSEYGFGVALLNDCKYGYDIHDHVMRLSLLRSPLFPNPEADRGDHHFTYALLPHAGDFRTGSVIPEGYLLNEHFTSMLHPATSGSLPERFSLCSTDAANLVLETCKRAEDGHGWILRLYEAWGMHTRAKIQLPGFCSVTPSDLLERPTATRESCGGCYSLECHPYQVVTLRIEE